ncbi:MAG: hypothetical protein IPM63_12240 [Acidobacteriota bacterium]|nr:MAG: hypothetical protein IPM63_12240 [Acidobacteriota bacterium]
MSVSKRSIEITGGKRSRAMLAAALLAFAVLAALAFTGSATSAFFAPVQDNPSSTVFINEFHYDNGGTDAGEFIEIAGPAGTDLAGYSIVLYNGNGGAAYDTDPLSGSIPDQQGGFGTVVLNYPSNGIQNGSPDGIALVGPGNALIQFLCYEGTFTAVDGIANGVTCTDIGVSEPGSDPTGLSLQLTGSGSTYGDFSWNAPTIETPGQPNTGQTFGGGGTPTPTPTPTASPTPTPTATPTPTPGPVANVVINELDSDTPGSDVAEFVELFDGGTGNTSLNGLVVVFFNGNGDTSYGAFDLDGYVTDADGYFVLGNAAVPGVDLLFGNGLLQNGADSVAVYAANATDFPNGSPVTTSGLIDAAVYGTADPDDAELLVLLNAGEPQADESGRGAPADDSIGRCPNGEGGARNTSGYIQFAPTPGAANDCPLPAVPRTIAEIQGSGTDSPFEGTAVITNGIVTGIKSNGFFMQEPDTSADADPLTSEGIFVFTSALPTATVGDAVTVTGTAGEFFNLTQISAATGEVTVVSAGNALPSPIILTTTILDPSGPQDQLERFEGMRVFADSVRSVAPTNNFGEIWTVIEGVDRPLREPGIDNAFTIPPDPTSGVPDCCIPLWDGNPERIMIDTDGLAGSVRINVTTNVSLTGITGPLDFNFGDYKIDPEAAPAVASPNLSAAPIRERAAGELTVGSFNIENFDNDEPQRRKAALAIRTIMGSPDILGVIEIRDLASLQALAQQINDDSVNAGEPNPGYSAHLVLAPNGSSQNVGFLVRSSVQVDSVTQERAADTFIHPVTGQSLVLHDRPPLVLRATVNPALDPRQIIVVVNHPRSFIDIEDLGSTGIFVREKRKLQAESIAGLLQELQTASPGTPVFAVGDYNAYQFNDGYTDPSGTIRGIPTGDNELVVDNSPDLVNPDFVNLTDGLPADQRYTFIFEGTPQAIDHVFVNPEANAIVTGYAVARVNSDYPESAEFLDVSRPEASSDHDAPIAFFRFPIRETTTAVSDVQVTYDTQGQNVQLSASVVSQGFTVNEGTVTFTITDGAGTTIGLAGPAQVTNGSASADFVLPGSVDPQALRIDAVFSGGAATAGSSGNGTLSVSYRICPLYNPQFAIRKGIPYPFAIRLCDVDGRNLSEREVEVEALYASPAGNPEIQIPVSSVGILNRNNRFWYSFFLRTYVFYLKTNSFESGDYVLYFKAGDDPKLHKAGFRIR